MMLRSIISACWRWVASPFAAGQSLTKVSAERKYKPTVEVLETRLVPAWVVNDLTTLTAASLVQNLLGPSVTATNIQYTGDQKAAGIFSDTNNATGIKNGVVLSSGSAKGVAGPNTDTAFSTDNGGAGDPDLDAIISPDIGYDASTLEFDFVPKGSILSFQYVFGSDEYNEFAPPNFGINDVFGFFLNGKNIALLPGTSTPVSIATVNAVTNSKYFVDNDQQPGPRDTQMDGLTTVLSVTVNVKPGVVNHIKLTIEDAADGVYDSWVLLKAGSLGAADIRTYAPLRYVYNRFTGLYSGNFLFANISTVSLGGPLYAIFLALPPGVTVANAKGKTASGATYFAFPGGKGLPAGSKLSITITFRNPGRINFGPFFQHHPITIAAGIS
ncbi:MAG: choice-of-anchor L domain-containing protein [Planctomycetes bacterium]|nr:choice-of-anchor L domain-containing protein [Planctomycetota bacterium]